MKAFECVDEWPPEFVQLYLEDLGMQQTWTDPDSPACIHFVRNVTTAFSVSVPQSAGDGSQAGTSGFGDDNRLLVDAVCVSCSLISSDKYFTSCLLLLLLLSQRKVETGHLQQGLPCRTLGTYTINMVAQF